MNDRVNRRGKILLGVSGLLALVILLFVPVAHAYETRGGEDVTVGPDEVIEDDLYVSAYTFTLEGTVQGDLVVMGSNITINGDVEGDLLVMAQSVIVKGNVADDVRIGAGVIVLADNAQVGDDLLTFGYSLETEADTSVGGDVVFAGNQSLLAGTIGGDANVASTGLELRGHVEGNLKADLGGAGEQMRFSPFSFMANVPPVPTVPGGLTLGETASVAGNLDYSSPTRAGVALEKVGGEISYEEEARADEQPAQVWRNRIFGNLRRFVALTLVGLLMIWVVPQATQDLAGTLREKPFPSLGWGILTVVGVSIAFFVIVLATLLLALLLNLVTLNGLMGTVVILGTLALLALVVLFGVAFAYVTKIVVAYLGGRLILGGVEADWVQNPIIPLILGLFIFVILTAIPWVGGLFNFIAVLMGLGSLWLLGAQLLRRSEPQS